jgi:hypothetical protein
LISTFHCDDVTQKLSVPDCRRHVGERTKHFAE